MAAAGSDMILFNFKNPQDIKPWQVINDTVMGGVSESSLQPGEAGTAVFTGYVSLKNFGGFCSASSRGSTTYDLSGYDGIAVRIKGDGKRYKLTLKTDTSFSGFSYQYAFTSRKDEWMIVKAPFSEFIASFRGATVSDAGPIKRSEIRSCGLLIGDKQEGPFLLKIEWVKGY